MAGLTSWVSSEVQEGAGLDEGRGGQVRAGGVWQRGEGWRQELQGVFQAEVVTGAREVDELLGPLPIVGRRKGQRNQKALGILGAEGRPSSVQTRVGPVCRADIPPRLGQTPHNALEQMSHCAFGAG